MQRLNREYYPGLDFNESLPEKVLQFGEGNFLRAFVDWMFHMLNKNNLFNGSIVGVQPIEYGLTDQINDQQGLYTLITRGWDNGEIKSKTEVITSISRAINPYANFQQYIDCAKNPEMRVIISNTTEAGIEYRAEDRLSDKPPKSFPAKLTVFLYERFKAFEGDTQKGFIIIPCELIDNNGDQLKSIVLRYAHEWNLESGFVNWIENANYFTNTLVDRIVTGFPKSEADILTDQLGYRDDLLDICEVYHLWGIEHCQSFENELPFQKAGLNVFWTHDIKPFKQRKVRILNGAHTILALTAYLCGKNTVKECMDDPIMNTYIKNCIFKEILPTLDMPQKELHAYADIVLVRFANPYIQHYLLSIALNSFSKFRTRVLPSIIKYAENNRRSPDILTFSMAALFAFYKGQKGDQETLTGHRAGETYPIIDDLPIMEMMKQFWEDYDGTREKIKDLVKNTLGKAALWGSDLNTLPGLSEGVTDYLYSIEQYGVIKTISKLIQSGERVIRYIYSHTSKG